MNRERLRKLLDKVRRKQIAVDDALDELRFAPVADLGFARLDLQRELRRGLPEAVLGAGKTTDEIVRIVTGLHEAGQTALVTRVGPEVHEAVAATFPRALYHPEGRLVVLRAGRRPGRRPGVLVVTAGTSDRAVAEEAAVTAEELGNQVERIHDVGVAGLHRLVPHLPAMAKARVIVVVAGMEGALASVVAGLTDCPVIGVPTSTGYGSAYGGEAALLAMLNSCASGLTVVNIDNGYGAGVAAALINRPTRRSAPRSKPGKPRSRSRR